MIPLSFRYARRALPALLLLGLSSTLVAQEYVWTETRFHRVHLRNGNFIDGKVTLVKEREVMLTMPVGDMVIRKDSIDRIELMKIRTLGEKPKLDPPLKKAGAAVPVSAVVKPDPAARRTILAAPPIDDNVRDNLRTILSRFSFAKADQKDGLVREMARQPHAAPYLAWLLPSLDPDLAPQVAGALQKMREPGSQPYLVVALESPKPYIRILAIDLLADQGNAEVLDPVRRCIADDVPGVKVAAMGAATRLGDKEALRSVLDHLEDGDPVVRAAAINNALTLGNRIGRMSDVQDSIKLALMSARGQALLDLAWAAGRTGRKELWPVLASYAFEADPKLRGTIVEALAALAVPESVEVLVQRLRTEDDKQVRLRLAAAAEALKNAEAVPPLIDWLRSQDIEIVNAAAKSLQSITRQRYGTSHQKWEDWWNSTRPK